MASNCLADRVALVTGGASGLGRATCLALAAQGAHVVVADINESGAAQTLERIRAAGDSGQTQLLDVADGSSRAEALDKVSRDHEEAFNILVNVAGIDRPGYFDDVSAEEFRLVNAVNYEGPIFLMREFIRWANDHRDAPIAEIVNVVSISAITVGSGAVAYNSSKAAFAKATEIAQREVLERGYHCRIQGIMPAAMDTPMMEQWGIPRDRMMDPAWVAAEIVHAVRRPAGCYAQNLVITPSAEPDWPR